MMDANPVKSPMETSFDLSSISDSVWAGEKQDRKKKEKKGYSGFVFFVEDDPTAWIVKEQGFGTPSTMKTEYFSMSQACQEALWLLKTLTPYLLGVTMTLLCDSQASACFAHDPDVSEVRSRCISIRYHYPDRTTALGVQHVEGRKNSADLLTRALTAVLQHSCRLHFVHS
uniref:Reverse transcriptase Ty1/copia-type domain-containing protein n=1 Tax=Compsopogon caeruleus TaxID=31354 RepID=A0A7S1XGR9_9RHOD|mmetsp:Transcript_6694/g.13591  ORF Transcript_6694/g.13591 Transcript_6694/m.13591 type:complete len:171 (+) Transcript_6694:86-598(+)